MMRIDFLTLFPEMMERVMSESIIGRAKTAGFIEIYAHQIRDYSADKHRRTDDAPYGGGFGMVMTPQPIYDCFQAVCGQAGTRPHLIYLSPQGKTLTQQRALELSKMPNIALLCGHYEGVDERVLEEIVDEEISIGDYVLTGGELSALVVADTVARLVPGVLADEEAYTSESHFCGLLEHPHYTRPPVWMGREVPEVLLTGHHANIEKWRHEQACERTKNKRPDIFKGYSTEKIDLEEALKSLTSTLDKCEKAFEKLREGMPQHTLTKRRIKALRLSIELINRELSDIR